MDTDTEMGETETPAGRLDWPVNGSDPRDPGTELLSHARQLINQGKPTQALQAVVLAIRTRGGEEAVLTALNRAREVYRTRLHENAAADQLARLFAECAIAEAQPPKIEPSRIDNTISSFMLDARATPIDPNGMSILAETGRTQIVIDASSDGSSFICLQCGGLVSAHRKDEHYSYWCCRL